MRRPISLVMVILIIISLFTLPVFAVELNSSAVEYIYWAFMNYEAEIDVSEYNISNDDMIELVQYELSEHPELYFVDDSYTMYSNPQTHIVGKLEFSYKGTPQEINSQLALINSLKADWESGIVSTWSVEELLLYTNDYICKNFTYDIRAYYDAANANYDIYKMVRDKKGVCEAYSGLFKYLVSSKGIDCSYAKSNAARHMWNVVKLDGVTYHIDVTQNDPVNAFWNEDRTATLVAERDNLGSVTHKYFLLNSEEIAATGGQHYGWFLDGIGFTDSTAADNKYSTGYFWHDSASQCVYLDGKWYFVSSHYNNKYMTKLCEADTLTSYRELVTVPYNWPAQNGYLTLGFYSGLSAYNGRIFFTTDKDINFYNIEEQALYSVEVDPSILGTTNHFYGSNIEGRKFYMQVSQLNSVTNYDVVLVELCKEGHTPGEFVCVDDGTVSGCEIYKKYCYICGEVVETKIEGHIHEYGTEWSNDATSHYHECSVCGDRNDEEEHIYDNACDTTCNICGYVRVTTPHPYNTEWSNDSNYHWYECSECGNIKSKEAHVYDGDCDTTCNKCGYVRTASPHSYKTAWSSDENTHYRECTVCGNRKNVANHVYDNDCDTSCSVCGYIRTVDPHPYETEWSSDSSNHWHECSSCGIKKDVEAHVYDNACDATCNKCGYIRQVGAHSYSSEWSKDEDTHYHECEICSNRIDISVHIYDNDCDTICNICGYVRQVGAHNYNEIWSNDSSNHWHECSSCGIKKDVETHIYDNACDTTCNKCGYVRAVSPHSYKTVWSSDLTSHWHECSICGAKTDIQSHIYDSDCDTDCNICGHIRTAQHEYSEIWSHNAQSHYHECILCGDKADLSEHIYDNACDTDCNVCGYTRTSGAHSLGGYSYAVQATPESDGYLVAVCSICGKEVQKPVHYSIIGDVNGDGKVNSKDLTRLKKYLAGEDVEIYSGANCNSDKTINSKDLTRLKKILAGQA